MLSTLIIAALLIWFFASIRGLQDRLAKAEASISDLKLKLQRTGGAPFPEPAEEEPEPAEPSAHELPPSVEPASPPTAVPITPIDPEPASAAPAAAAPSAPSFEERVGTRWAVWVGGAALAVGGIFLVNYSIEAGLIGPTTRVIFGAVFALALIGAGEWMRRGERTLPVDIVPSAHIPGILTAAGTVVLFGTIYAAHALYGLIGPGVAFVLLGAAGLAAMLASALHGPALAGIGLVGAMVTPLLVSSSAPNPWPVVLFLAVVSASALALARLRHWLWLALASVAGVVLWGGALAQPIGDTWVWAAFVHALIQLGLTGLFFAVEPHVLTPDDKSEPDGAAAAALGALTLLVVLVLAATAVAAGTDTDWLVFSAIAMALLAGTAWLSASSALASVFSGVVAIAVAFLWQGIDAPPPATNLWPAVGAVMRLPDELHVYFPFVAFSSLAVALVAALRLRVGRDLPASTAGLYALAATMTPLTALTVAYLRITQFDGSIPFALFGLVLALLFADAANRFQKDEGDPPATAPHLAAGAFAAAAIAALAFALVVSLDRGYLTVALALSALGTSYVATLKRIPMLRYAVAALGVVVLGRVVWDPAIMGADVGSWPILNWLLVGYGVPAACLRSFSPAVTDAGRGLRSEHCGYPVCHFPGTACLLRDPPPDARRQPSRVRFELDRAGFVDIREPRARRRDAQARSRTGQSRVPGGVLCLRSCRGPVCRARTGLLPEPLFRIRADRRRLDYQRSRPGLSVACRSWRSIWRAPRVGCDRSGTRSVRRASPTCSPSCT